MTLEEVVEKKDLPQNGAGDLRNTIEQPAERGRLRRVYTDTFLPLNGRRRSDSDSGRGRSTWTKLLKK